MIIRLIIALLLLSSPALAGFGMQIISGKPIPAAASYLFEEDFADNSAGWLIENGASITSGYALLNTGYGYIWRNMSSELTTGQQYTATFDVTYVGGGGLWLTFIYPHPTLLGDYISTTGTFSRTFTATTDGVLVIVIDDGTTVGEYHVDNLRICAGATCD